MERGWGWFSAAGPFLFSHTPYFCRVVLWSFVTHRVARLRRSLPSSPLPGLSFRRPILASRCRVVLPNTSTLMA